MIKHQKHHRTMERQYDVTVDPIMMRQAIMMLH